MPGAMQNKKQCDLQTSIHLAVIESNIQVSGYACTAYYIMLEDSTNHFSLVRFIQDFYELDNLLQLHFPKQRIPLPKVEQQKKKKNHLFGSLKKKKKTSAERLERYLRHALTHPIGKTSLFRDFLSAQREEDRVIPKDIVRQMVTQHHTTMVTQHLSLPPSPPLSKQEEMPVTYSVFQDFIEDFDQNDLNPSTLLDDPMCSSILGQEEYELKDRIRDFELLKVLGKGATGKVILVREQKSHGLFALKSITKSWSITRREVEHIRMERDILVSLAAIRHPFLIRLHAAFQDSQNLYLVLDYHAGADLATLLQRYIFFPPEQCRLYAAEIVMGLQELHRNNILYRDLKPENVLLAADGHLVLTDFGLSKLFYQGDSRYDHRTTTFCGTPEYLAPEIILQEEAYSYAADYWSLGTMLYEMLTGITPFAADCLEDMYDRVLYDDLVFPDGLDDPEAQDLICGLLERDPLERLGAGIGGVFEIRTHAYFADHLSWKDVYTKQIRPTYVPRRKDETDLSHFDQDFLEMSTELNEMFEVDDCSPPLGLTANAFRGYSYIEPESEPSDPLSSHSLKSEASFISQDNGYYDDYDSEGVIEEEEEEQNSYLKKEQGPYKAFLDTGMYPYKLNHHTSSVCFGQDIRHSVINQVIKEDDSSLWRP
ncbi:kinase-like domain-containing protein [Blakeslea trispora]|nr:kinase-like domain-containing protein [Blakeslea trispora]